LRHIGGLLYSTTDGFFGKKKRVEQKVSFVMHDEKTSICINAAA
jgi:hypothetical protein